MTKPLAFIIEDDPQLSIVFNLSLQNDFETETIMDGDAALLRIAQVKPALIVLDLHLPGASGMEILKKVRSDERLAKTFVILATADPLQADVLQEQADLVLIKPVSPMQLRELASRLLSKFSA